MKKEINSKSRRKWIMGGLAAFASVALLTTGFAVWVVGVTQTEQKGDVTVDVDTARNDNVTFEVTLSDNKIALQEAKTDTSSEGHENDFVKIENNGSEEQKTDFEVSFSKFEITMPENRYDQVKISFNKDGESVVDNTVAAGGDQFKSDFDTNTKFQETCKNRKTYFDLKDNEDGIVTWNLNEKGVKSKFIETKSNSGTVTYKLIKMEDVTLFQWGSFFGNQAPSEFYNKTLLSNTTDQTTENAEKVKMELDSMYNKYVNENNAVKVSLLFELASSKGNTVND